MDQDQDRDIAIVGMSAMFPGARDVAAYWRNVVNGVDAITEVPPERWPDVTPGRRLEVGGLDLPRRGGFVPTPIEFDALRHRVVPSAAASPTFDQFVVIDLVDRALDDAGVKPDDSVREHTDLVIGRGGYPSAGVAQSMSQAEGIDWFVRYLAANVVDLAPSDRDAIARDIRDRVGGTSAESVEATVPNFVASRTANRLDLRGSAYVIDAACASSLIAVEHVVDRLRTGRSDLGVAAGVNFFQYPAFWWMLGTVGALSMSGECRPFDAAADGIVLSEGAGAVVLKRMSDAARDGNEVYAVIKGVGSSSDGRGTGLLAPSSSGQRLALERAYRDARVSPDTVGLLEAHGTGTRIGDAAEAETIRSIFGGRTGPLPRRPVASVKSMIGHSIPAAGIASLVKLALALRDKVVPASLNVATPIQGLADSDFYVNTEIRPWVHPLGGAPRRAAANAFGFGGVNSHVVLEEVDPGRPRRRGGPATTALPDVAKAREPVSVIDRPTELLVVTGATRSDLVDQLRDLVEMIRTAGAEPEAESVAFELANRADTGLPWRLVAVCPSGSLLDDVELVLERLEADLDPSDLGVTITRCDSTDGQVAALLGGSAPGLQADLPEQQLTKALHMPSFRYVLDVVERGTGRPDDPYPVSLHLRPPPGTDPQERHRMRSRFALGEADETTPAAEWPLLQSVMPAIKYGAWLAVKDLGLAVDRLVAISSGEVTALCAAGVVDFEPMIEMVAGLFSDDRYITFPWSTITSGFIFASPAQLEPFLERYPDVQISMHLAENMVTLCGLTDSFAELQSELREHGMVVAVMPLAGIHSRHLEPIADALAADVFSRFELSEPTLPIYTATADGVTDGTAAEIATLAAECVKRPLHLWQLIRRLPSEGVDTVVELGPTPHHAQFVSEAPEGAEVTGLVTEVANVHPMTQLQNVVAELLAAGKQVDPVGLFAGRRPTPFVPEQLDPSSRTVELTTAWRPLGSPDSDAGRWRTDPGTAQRGPSRPLVGAVIEHDPGRRIRQRLRFAMDLDTHIADHTFVANDGRPPMERFPVVALTMLVEAMAETSLLLTDASAVHEVLDVKVTRWVSLDGRRELEADVVATVVSDPDRSDSPIRVETSLAVGGVEHGSAVFLVGDGPAESQATPRDLVHEGHVGQSIDPADIYRQRLFFHGEAFQCLAAIDAVSSSGVTGRLVTREPAELFARGESPSLALDPVILDGVGQLIASWFLESDLKMLPTMIERIEVLGPTPPPGTLVRAVAVPRIVDPEAYFTVFDAEVDDGSGRVWLRITGFRDWMFSEEPVLAGVRHAPSTHRAASELRLPGLPHDLTVTLMPRFALNELQAKVLPRIVLHPEEFRRYEKLESRRRRIDFALGRLALKDAARIALGTALFPHTVEARLIADRGLIVQIPGVDQRIHGSITHSPAGVAAALSPRPVGIDVEAVATVAAVEVTSFTDEGELALGGGVMEESHWATALWVAKEAAAKLAGTGLGGRPRRWVAAGYDHGRGVVSIADRETGRTADVHLGWLDGAVIGVAIDPTAAPA